ncbi:unnamed protein product [Cuscuta epithymum]|uniref:H15 domain-containing protein n=1 Tax=Cuscuta epithymum TaxID=186058 RepID=A0AAV0GEQ7_9ASTE|nr:unnamed protein product [Cuscuta epithymum]
MAAAEDQQPESLPDYPQMIMAAIEELNEKDGSSKDDISRHIETAKGGVPPSHHALLIHSLERMIQSGQLVLMKNNYMKADANAPPRRGRGRPAKAKTASPTEAPVSGPPRPRGRPPKARDPLAPESSSMKKASASIPGRKRGRPSKASNAGAAAAPPAASGAPVAPRGRGRPPKVKVNPAMAATVGA